MNYLPQADTWIQKHKAIEANASKTRSRGHHRHIRTHRLHKKRKYIHHRKYKTFKQR
jgi:hypothetical protein